MLEKLKKGGIYWVSVGDARHEPTLAQVSHCKNAYSDVFGIKFIFAPYYIKPFGHKGKDAIWNALVNLEKTGITIESIRVLANKIETIKKMPGFVPAEKIGLTDCIGAIYGIKIHGDTYA